MTTTAATVGDLDIGAFLVWYSPFPLDLDEPPQLPARGQPPAQMPVWRVPPTVAEPRPFIPGIKLQVLQLAREGFTAAEISAALHRPISTVRGDAEDIRKAGVAVSITRSPTKRRGFDARVVLETPGLSDLEIRIVRAIAAAPLVTNGVLAAELGISKSRLASSVARAVRAFRTWRSGRSPKLARETECRAEREIRLARAAGRYCPCGLTAPCADHAVGDRPGTQVPTKAKTGRHGQMVRSGTAASCPKLAALPRKSR